jgi:HK97 family phage portal protein
MNLNPFKFGPALNIGPVKKNPLAKNYYDLGQMFMAYVSQLNDGFGVVNFTNDHAALRFSAIYNCCRVLAETFSSAPLIEYRKLPNGDRLVTNETGIWDVLANVPNEEMSDFNFNEMGMYQLNLGGNFVSQRLVNKYGGLVGLTPFRWHRVIIMRKDMIGPLIYKVTPQNGFPEQILSRGEVFHVPGPSLNGIIGLTPIEFYGAAAKLGLNYEKFLTKFIQNGALSSGMFKHPGGLKDEAYQALKKDLKKEYQGMENAGVPMLLEDGLDFIHLTMKLADAELLLSRKFQIEEIARFYRVPLHMVGDLSRSTNNNIEHQSLEFIMYTMLPWFKRWEACIKTQLLTRQQRAAGYFFEYDMHGLLRGDAQSMAQAFATGRQWGWLSVNDIRRSLNINSIGPEGDIYLQPMNMIKAGTEPDAIKKTTDKLVNDILQLIQSGRA